MGYGNYTLKQAKDQVGPGWSPLIEEVYSILPKGTKVVQIKEKFGDLRIYLNSATEELWQKVAEITNRSGSICEDCGQPGKHTDNGGWIMTLCPVCQKKRNRDE